MRSQRFLQFFGRDFIPLNSPVLFVQQRGWMVMPVDLSKRFVAASAVLSLIPAIDDRPDEAGLWRFSDLLQAFLPTGVSFARWIYRCRVGGHMPR